MHGRFLCKESFRGISLDTLTALVISAIDPLNGAGFTLDLGVLEILGIKAMGIPTAIIPQTPEGVISIKEFDRKILLEILKSTLSFEKPSGLKVSIMGKLISQVPNIAKNINGPKVLDPIIEPGKMRIISKREIKKLRKMIPFFDYITPNLPEAEEILGRKIKDPGRACEKMSSIFGVKVYLKGGHTQLKIDYFCTGKEAVEMKPSRIFPYEVHGTGCFFSSVLLGFLMKGNTSIDAVSRAKELLEVAYSAALKTGRGKRMLQLQSLIKRGSNRD